MTLNMAPVEVPALFEQSINSVEDLARKKSIEIKMDCPKLLIEADGSRLVQVLVNLLSNAIKFSPTKTTIEMSVKQDGKQVLFEVADQGRGIPQDQIETVFDRFTQVEAADGKNGQGSGLGLAICKAIVTQHNGEIGVRSRPNQGSTFWFTVPSPDQV
jgi:signal transduction histidine kinase